MKKTLIEIVQDCLNDTDGDEVNSIDDTVESTQVANIVRSTYEALIINRDWPHTKKLLQVTPSADNAKPTHMTLADNIKKMVYLNYNKQKTGETRRRYEPIKYLDPDDFLRVLNNRDNDQSFIDSIVDDSGVILSIRNDIAPSYYTSFDDEGIVFDSYDSAVDNSLQASKVQAMAYVIPTFTLSDTFIPDLPDFAFPAFINECKSAVSLKLRQIQDVKAETEARRQQRWLARNDNKVNGGTKYPDYGRRGKRGFNK